MQTQQGLIQFEIMAYGSNGNGPCVIPNGLTLSWTSGSVAFNSTTGQQYFQYQCDSTTIVFNGYVTGEL